MHQPLDHALNNPSLSSLDGVVQCCWTSGLGTLRDDDDDDDVGGTWKGLLHGDIAA